MLFVSSARAISGQDGHSRYDVLSAVTNAVFIYLKFYFVFTCAAACLHLLVKHCRKHYEVC